MKNALWLSIILIALLAGEIVYYSLGGSLVLYFSPQLMLMTSVFIGVLLGSRPAMIWGAAAGIVQELAFMRPDAVFGMTPLVYLWAGYLAAFSFFGRADASNFVIGMMVSAAGIFFGAAAGRLLGAAFGAPNDLLFGPVTWTQVLSWMIQSAVLGPLWMKLLMKCVAAREPRFARLR